MFVAISQRARESCVKDMAARALYISDCPFYAFLQGVVTAESNRHGLLLEEPKTLLFKGNTYSLQVSIQDLPQFPWSIKPFSTCQVRIHFIHYILQEEEEPSCCRSSILCRTDHFNLAADLMRFDEVLGRTTFPHQSERRLIIAGVCYEMYSEQDI